MEIFYEKLRTPLVIFWELTQRCNLRCLHCYTHAGNNNFQLTFEKLSFILEKIIKQDVFSLGLGGGEPLLVEELSQIIKIATNKNIDVSVSTNGLLLNYETACELKKSGLSLIQISIDGLEKTHNTIRGKGSFKKAVDALKNAKKAGLVTRLGLTINNLNYKEIEQVFNLSLELNVDWFIAFRYMESGRSGSKLALNKESLKIATSQLIKLHKKYPLKVFFEKLVFFPFLIDQNYISTKSCNAGLSILNIKANGDITACPHICEPIIGNILETSINRIWQSTEIEMKDCIAPECQSCQFKKICGGGCKGVIYDNNNHKDPLCWL